MSDIPPHQWMTRLAEESPRGFARRTLREIALPMTHNSATEGLTSRTVMVGSFGYNIEDSVARGIARVLVRMPGVVSEVVLPLSVCQHNDQGLDSFLADQLLIGVRAFDLRVTFPSTDPAAARFHHGPTTWRGSLLAALENAQRRFFGLGDTRGEIVVLRLDNIDGASAAVRGVDFWRTLLGRMQSILGQSRLCTARSPASTRYADLVAAPIIVIANIHEPLVSELAPDFPWLRPSYASYDTDWANCKDVGFSVPAVRAYFEDSLQRPLAPNRLRQLQLHFQPGDTGDVVRRSVRNRGPVDVREETARASLNSLAVDWVLRASSDPRQSIAQPNIVSFDFYTPDMTAAFVRANRARQ